MIMNKEQRPKDLEVVYAILDGLIFQRLEIAKEDPKHPALVWLDMVIEGVEAYLEVLHSSLEQLNKNVIEVDFKNKRAA